MVKSVVCQTDLTWVSSDTPEQTVNASSKHQTLTPGAGSGSSSQPRVPTDGARSGTSAPRRTAIARKVKVVGAWVHTAEFKNPAASRPSAKATSTFKKKGNGDRKAKGQDDPIKTFNHFGSLEDNTGMEVEASQTSLPSSLSGGTSSLI